MLLLLLSILRPPILLAQRRGQVAGDERCGGRDIGAAAAPTATRDILRPRGVCSTGFVRRFFF